MTRAHSRNRGGLDGLQQMEQLMRRTVKLYGEKRGFGTREVFCEEEEVQPDGKVFRKYTMGDYRWLTYKEIDERIDLIAAGLFKLGVRPRQNLVILAETRMEWMLTAQATLRNNIPLVTVYATLGVDGFVHALNESESTHVITSQDMLPKLIKAAPRVKSVTHIIYMENQASKLAAPKVDGINLIPFSKLYELGKINLEFSGEIPTPDSTAIIMYTSGSTGTPKGVVITHSNLLACAKGYLTIFPETTEKDSYVAYLPLAHVMEIACESMMISNGARIGYSSPQTLTDKGTGIKAGQRGDAIVLEPSMMVTVPVILDRIRKGVVEGAEAKGFFSKLLFRHAIVYKSFWVKAGYTTPLLNRLVFNKIKAVLGGNVRVVAVGSAPLCAETFDFVKICFDILLLRGYGLTETTSGAAVCEFTDNSDGSNVGCPLVDVYIKLDNWSDGGYTVNDKPNPRGEILVGGVTVAKSYYKNESLSREVFLEEDGIRWFRTGDIGELLPNGTLKIVDRKKDLIKLQFGEYVSLGKVEAELKTLPLVDNICVYGNSYYTFMVALISPNPKALEALAAQIGIENKSLRELCENPEIVRLATEQLVRHGKHCNLNKMEIPAKFKLCPEEWIPDSGLVTAALKIRRKQINDFYKMDIDRMYEDSKNV
ncbi:long-chain-fatty-acid--CoA ligase 4 [Galendromus occidentalis]|uniref:long-chain-fatty-acid--CoA ligase n=1 Tax=Galendromus occidentalis TaxID=34638 RepID=A0AAJ7WIM4_9ACAR|nr:long-chain-fatty-acid--CoA ligase 4 [Galendromus occidentalis]